MLDLSHCNILQYLAAKCRRQIVATLLEAVSITLVELGQQVKTGIFLMLRFLGNWFNVRIEIKAGLANYL